MSMTPRERVLAALNHEEPDRVPIVIGASNATGIQMEPYQELKERLQIAAPDRHLYDWPEFGTAEIDEETLRILGSDVRGVLDRRPKSECEQNERRRPGEPYVDSWGRGRVEVEPGVWFPAMHPLKDAKEVNDFENYPHWPDMNDPTRVAHVHEEAFRLAQEGQYAIMATPWLLFPFERSMGLQGMETFLMNLAERPDFARALLERCAEYCKTLMGHFLKELGDHVDIIKIGDDLGTSTSLLISPRMYREILKPIHADYISFIKERTKAKVFFHSDGDIFPLIEDFIEIGVDILNPIQTSAGRMADLKELKDRYGKDLVLCGAIDTTRILPHGTPVEVREEVRRVIDILGPGGGYLLAAVHTIQRGVPAENILSMVDAAKEYGSYPIR